jgi:DNA-binding transcriptional ArsR family regulator
MHHCDLSTEPLIQLMGCKRGRQVLLFNLMVEKRIPELDDRNLNAVFSALADPTRRAIVHRLATGEASVGELAEPFRMSFQAVSKHVQVLEHAGLIERSRRAQQRPCRLRPDALRDASGWLGDYRQLWETSFDRLDEHLTKQKGSQR